MVTTYATSWIGGRHYRLGLDSRKVPVLVIERGRYSLTIEGAAAILEHLSFWARRHPEFVALARRRLVGAATYATESEVAA